MICNNRKLTDEETIRDSAFRQSATQAAIRCRVAPSFLKLPFIARYLCCALILVVIPGTGSVASAETASATEDLSWLRDVARPLKEPADLDPLLDRAARRRLVLLGEASHGTSEFYTWRAEISQRLIADHGFRFIAVEGDWVTCHRLNRYAKGHGDSSHTARDIMRSFTRWPSWMWANEEVADLIEWLRKHNQNLPAEQRVGFYGMDVYGEDEAKDKVAALLQPIRPELARRVAGKYACLDPYGGDLRTYARAVASGQPSCEREFRRVVDLLQEQLEEDEEIDRALYLHIKQTARVVKGAERHFRAMVSPGPDSWNSRVDHFHATVDNLLRHYGDNARGIVWAHNTHIGDARATSMIDRGRRNIGQTARERYGDESVFAVGFGTHRGTVMAGMRWGAQREIMTVPNAMPGSFEDQLHRAELSSALLLFDRYPDDHPLMQPIGHRAIGVVYDPARERMGNYVPSRIAQRYDAFIFFDSTRALRPITASE